MQSVVVSVIIPAYKHRDFIAGALDSVFAQTFTDYEVIVVNDGSPDDTADVLRPYITSGRIRYVEQPNGGQASARNRGLAMANGELIAFLDDDDTWPADKLQWQVEYLREHANVGVVAGCATVIDESGKVVTTKGVAGPVLFDSLFSGNPILSPGQTLIRKSHICRISGFSEGIWGADDLDMWFKLAGVAEIVITDCTALHYRLHDRGASQQTERMLLNTKKVLVKHLDSVSDLVKRRQLKREAYRFLYDYVGHTLLNRCKTDMKHGRAMDCLKRISAMRPLYPGLFYPGLLCRVLRDMTPRGFHRVENGCKSL